MTTMQTHTSGPWCIHRAYANAQTIALTDDNGESWEFTHTYISQGEKIIAEVQHQSKDSGWPHVHDVEEMWANARLIAAAPELLDAAVQLRDYLQTLAGEVQIPPSLYLQGKRAMDAAELAFSKAEGRGEP